MHDPKEKLELDRLREMLADSLVINDRSRAEQAVSVVTAGALLDIAISLRILANDAAGDQAAAAEDDIDTRAEPIPLAINDVVVLNDPDDPDDDDADELLVINTGETEGAQWIDVAWLSGKVDRKVWASQFKLVRALGDDADAVEPWLVAVTKAAKKAAKGNG